MEAHKNISLSCFTTLEQPITEKQANQLPQITDDGVQTLIPPVESHVDVPPNSTTEAIPIPLRFASENSSVQNLTLGEENSVSISSERASSTVHSRSEITTDVSKHHGATLKTDVEINKAISLSPIKETLSEFVDSSEEPEPLVPEKRLSSIETQVKPNTHSPADSASRFPVSLFDPLTPSTSASPPQLQPSRIASTSSFPNPNEYQPQDPCVPPKRPSKKHSPLAREPFAAKISPQQHTQFFGPPTPSNPQFPPPRVSSTSSLSTATPNERLPVDSFVNTRPPTKGVSKETRDLSRQINRLCVPQQAPGLLRGATHDEDAGKLVSSGALNEVADAPTQATDRAHLLYTAFTHTTTTAINCSSNPSEENKRAFEDSFQSTKRALNAQPLNDDKLAYEERVYNEEGVYQGAVTEMFTYANLDENQQYDLGTLRPAFIEPYKKATIEPPPLASKLTLASPVSRSNPFSHNKDQVTLAKATATASHNTTMKKGLLKAIASCGTRPEPLPGTPSALHLPPPPPVPFETSICQGLRAQAPFPLRLTTGVQLCCVQLERRASESWSAKRGGHPEIGSSASDLPEQHFLVVKTLPLTEFNPLEVLHQYLHPSRFVARIIGFGFSYISRRVIIITQYIRGYTLERLKKMVHHKTIHPFLLEDVLIRELVLYLAQLRDHKISHLDIKPANLILRSAPNDMLLSSPSNAERAALVRWTSPGVCWIDFGFAMFTQLAEIKKLARGTKHYISLELAKYIKRGIDQGNGQESPPITPEDDYVAAALTVATVLLGFHPLAELIKSKPVPSDVLDRFNDFEIEAYKQACCSFEELYTELESKLSDLLEVHCISKPTLDAILSLYKRVSLDEVASILNISLEPLTASL